MSYEHSLFIPRVSDRIILNAFEFLHAEYAMQNFSAIAASGVVFGQLPSQIGNTDLNSQWGLLFELKSSLLMSVTCNIGGLTISFVRGTRSNQKSGIYDEILLSFNQNVNSPSGEKRLEIAGYLAKKLKAFDPQRTLQSNGSEEAQLAALHESMLTRLEQLGEDLIRKTSETRNALEEEFHAKRLAAENEIAQIKSALLEATEIERSALKNEKEKVEQLQKSIDDRGNTHARRELRNRMLEDVKERIQSFGISERTADKRKPILMALLLTILLLAGLLIISVYELDRVIDLTYPSHTQPKDAGPTITVTSEMLYLSWFRVIAGTIALFFTMIYFVRWQNKWAEQHTTAEFQLQQFYIDVNRANWVIESGLEWRKETSSEMPQEILSSVTRNLFKSVDDSQPVIHPADELASALLGSASKLKLKAGENELEFDKPGKIKAEVQSKQE